MGDNGKLLDAHDLTGFDMVAAITQDTINYQLSQLFAAQVINNQLDISSKSPPTGHFKVAVDVHLQAALAAPTIEILDGSDNRRKVLFHVPMTKGTLSSSLMDDLSFENWEYVFTVNLDMKAIGHDAVQAHKAIPPEVKAHLDGFTDDMFTIQHLFLDFDDADLASFDRNQTKCPLPASWGGGDLTKQADGTGLALLQTALENHFSALAGTDNPYILGYTTPAKQAGNGSLPATQDPTGATFSTTYNPADPTLSTLNFLLMTGGKALPASAAPSAQLWVASAGTYGRFCISRAGFFDGWLLRQLQAALSTPIHPRHYSDSDMTNRKENPSNPPPRQKLGPSLGWDLAYSNIYTWTWPNGVNLEFNTHGDGNFTENDNRGMSLVIANPSPDTAQVSIINGSSSRKRNMDFRDVWDQCFWVTVSQAYTGAVTFSGGTDGALGMESKIKGQDIITEPGYCTGSGLNAALQENVTFNNDEASGVTSRLAQELGALQAGVDGVRSRFVFPAGNIFFFKNPQFDAAGNLLVDVTYKM
jgi:hypothetical protein